MRTGRDFEYHNMIILTRYVFYLNNLVISQGVVAILYSRTIKKCQL